MTYSPLTKRPPARIAAFVAALASAAGAALLAACGPEFNWREVRPAGEAYAVMLPGKPADMQRPIDLDGLGVTMTMYGAQAGGASFVVGSVKLPDDAPATQRKATEAMRVAMVRNIAGTEGEVRAVTVPVVDAGGRAVAHAVAMRVRATGQARGKPMSLQGAFFARGDHAWQAVAVGERLDEEQATTFLDSLRLLQ